jgi:HEAT repeat protein
LDRWYQETDAGVQQAILGALRDLRDRQAEAVFTVALGSRDEAVQIAAVQGLGALAQPGSVELLEKVFSHDPSPVLGDAILSAMQQIGTPEAQAFLTGLAYSEKPEIRARAVEALGHLGGRNAAATVQQGLGDPDTRVRVTALQHLPRLLDPEVVEMDLERACQDPEPEVRTTAIRKITAGGRVAALRSQWPALLSDPEPFVRFEALVALLHYPEALPEEIRAAVRSLQEYGDPSSLRLMAGRVLAAAERTSQAKSTQRIKPGKEK